MQVQAVDSGREGPFGVFAEEGRIFGETAVSGHSGEGLGPDEGLSPGPGPGRDVRVDVVAVECPEFTHGDVGGRCSGYGGERSPVGLLAELHPGLVYPFLRDVPGVLLVEDGNGVFEIVAEAVGKGSVEFRTDRKGQPRHRIIAFEPDEIIPERLGPVLFPALIAVHQEVAEAVAYPVVEALLERSEDVVPVIVHELPVKLAHFHGLAYYVVGHGMGPCHGAGISHPEYPPFPLRGVPADIPFVVCES